MKKRFDGRWAVNLPRRRPLAMTMSAGSVFQMCGAATAKARLPSVDSLTSAIPHVHPRDKSLLQSGSQQLD